MVPFLGRIDSLDWEELVHGVRSFWVCTHFVVWCPLGHTLAVILGTHHLYLGATVSW